MIVESSISHPGKTINEDLLIIQPSCIGILDGSSGLGGEDFGASEFVASYSEHFIECTSRGESLLEAANHALEYIRDKYSRTTTSVPPSASLMIIKETNDNLQVLSIGDCYCILFFDNDEYLLIYKDEVAPFDNAVIDRLIELHSKTGRDICDLLKTHEIQQMLLSNRMKMNTDKGYRILAPNMSKIKEEEILVLPKEHITSIVLFSDGFSSKLNTFIHKNWDLNSVYQELRKEELSDTALNEHPRLKMSDDASAIVALLKDD